MRIDSYLVSQGYFESRAKAVAAIKAGKVSLDGRVVKKPSEKVGEGAVIQAEAAHPWVSRGGIKLAHALEIFDVNVSRRTALDVGSSTGGFTDVLLDHGAAKVYAVDVGREQLHVKLRSDSRVISMESMDARELVASQFEPVPDLVVCDASFISLMKVLEQPLSLVPTGSDLVSLIKPQFEVGKAHIGKGGIVNSQEAANIALHEVQNWLRGQGWDIKSTDISPITGGDGNQEFLTHAVKL